MKYICRGKSLENGEWIVGYFQPPVPNANHGVSLSRFTQRGYLEDIDVDEKTVGSYTGFCDAGGNRIFEGDILKISYSGGQIFCIVKFGHYGKYNQGWHVKFFSNTSLRPELFFWLRKRNVTIVGNKYDNPEFMEEKEWK